MLRTGELPPLHGIAFIGMGMGFLGPGQGVAAFSVLMGLDLRQGAPQVSAVVIAADGMRMDHKVRKPADQILVLVIAVFAVLVDVQRFRVTNRHGAPDLRHLGVARLGMGVGGNLAPGSFQSDGGQNQRVDRAEHHYTGHAGYNPVPQGLSPVCLCILFRVLQRVLFHIQVTFSPILRFRSWAAARPGIQFFQLSAPWKCSQPPCCGSPPKRTGGHPCRSTGYPAPGRVIQCHSLQGLFLSGMVRPATYRPHTHFRRHQYPPTGRDWRYSV